MVRRRGELRLRPSSRMLPDGSSGILPEQTAQRTRCPVFHIVARRTPLRWDAIHGLVQGHALPLITSENRPADVAPEELVQVHPGSAPWDGPGRRRRGDPCADRRRGEPAAMAMIEELAGGRDLVPKIADAARRLRRRRPDLRGRWGAFVGSGPRTAYTKFNPPGAGDRRAAARRCDPRPGALSEVLGLLRRGDDRHPGATSGWPTSSGVAGGVSPAAPAMARRPTAGARLGLAADRPLSHHRRPSGGLPRQRRARGLPRPDVLRLGDTHSGFRGADARRQRRHRHLQVGRGGAPPAQGHALRGVLEPLLPRRCQRSTLRGVPPAASTPRSGERHHVAAKRQLVAGAADDPAADGQPLAPAGGGSRPGSTKPSKT